ncbi:TonB-dependent receptor [Luteimonas terrae]|uniref:Outer membrane receptor protein involved in Fe transport n=1 Tax=Luteimonas terrae TaxID=1530191 RepID=A0ABU1XST3_9GAMM|nr:TonB-dependent receptor [Luteimonas terrae]MDR7191807.1 outer membrane receptor protein involved in Fe transport [Luteimonas terrae]
MVGERLRSGQSSGRNGIAMKTHTLRNAISIALFAVTNGATSLAAAQDADRRETSQVTNEMQDAQQFDLPPGALGASLEAVGAQSGLRIAYSPALVANRQGRAVQGRMHWREAMARLLQGSGLDYRQADDGTVVIAPAFAEPERRVAPAPADARAPQGANATELETITVTGTRIRGGTTPSPVITLGSERIREEGFSDLGEVIRSVPQNFTGGQNPGATSGNLAGAGLGNQNVTGGSSLNLRGLGADATLTLLNGRRLSYGGFLQGVDISAIPVEAVSRVEIVADGASAIYGSDAVAGVGNVVLKREHEGFTVGARYGAATDGGLATREYTATGGAVWASGGLIATYKDAAVDPIYAADRDYASRLTHPTTLYPGSELSSALVSLHQSLGPKAEFKLDALRTQRKQAYDFFYLGSNTHVTPETTTSFVSPGVDLFLGNDWTLSATAALGRDRHRQYQTRQNLQTMETLLQLDECYCNESRIYELGAEGPLFELPGGSVRMAAAAGHRTNEFSQVNHVTNQQVTHGRESSRFVYAEVDIPLVGDGNRMAGIDGFVLTAAVRGEDYDTFGSVATPKFGLLYRPSGDFTMKASLGRSFKAPTLFDRNYATYVFLDPPGYYGGTGFPADATVMYYGGGNPDLEAERARTWSTSVAFHPRALPGLEAELTWFDIDFENRVKQPIANVAEALSNPVYRQFVTFAPSAAAQQEAIGAADTFTNYTGRPYDPGNVVALVSARRINVSTQRVRGLDLSSTYRLDVGAGRLALRGAVSWMESSEQTVAGQGSYELAGTLFNPPKFSGRVGAVWDRGGLMASAFANYSGGVTDTVNAEKGGSFTTMDATLRYAPGQPGAGLAGLEFTLSAQNLLDRAPPSYVPALAEYAPPYDATNYSPIGRFVSVSVSKQF